MSPPTDLLHTSLRFEFQLQRLFRLIHTFLLSTIDRLLRNEALLPYHFHKYYKDPAMLMYLYSFHLTAVPPFPTADPRLEMRLFQVLRCSHQSEHKKVLPENHIDILYTHYNNLK